MDINYQTPAEGILKTNDWGNSKVYKIACHCGGSDHDHDVWVEADEHDITVAIYTKVQSKWRVNRFRHIWTLLTKGYLEKEVEIALTKQQALYYAYTLKQAIQDVEDFRDKKSSDTAS
jgi:hypothetical protein